MNYYYWFTVQFQIWLRLRMSNSTEEKLNIFTEKLLKYEKAIEIIEQENDKFFLIVIGIVIFFMQCGFAFLEAGSVQ